MALACLSFVFMLFFMILCLTIPALVNLMPTSDSYAGLICYQVAAPLQICARLGQHQLLVYGTDPHSSANVFTKNTRLEKEILYTTRNHLLFVKKSR